jgi:hypothetical protein
VLTRLGEEVLLRPLDVARHGETDPR